MENIYTDISPQTWQVEKTTQEESEIISVIAYVVLFVIFNNLLTTKILCHNIYMILVILVIVRLTLLP